MKALVLCAGFGTRLRPLTDNFSKPALPIVGVPTVWYAIWSVLRELQPDRWMVNVGHCPETIHNALEIADLRNFARIAIDYSDESQQILGSSGALRKIKNWVGNDRLLVVNGDSVCFAPWRKMLEFHVNRKSPLTIHVRAFNGSEPYTNVAVDSKGLVVGFGEKSNQGTMFSGAYIIEPELLERLPDGVSELRPSLLEPLVQEARLYAYREDIEWFDTGTLATFFSAQFDVPSKLRAARPLIESTMYEFAPGSWRPKTWGGFRNKKFDVRNPVIVVGAPEYWENLAIENFGPRFCGISDYLGFGGDKASFEKALLENGTSDTLVFLNQSYSAKK